jgi:dihydroorotase
MNEKPIRLEITKPDDWHLHLRDGAAMRDVAKHSAKQLGRALIMPNLKPPVTTVAEALAYRQRVLAALPPGSAFDPYMSLYLTDETSIREIVRAADEPYVLGFKLYPANATTNSAAGVTDLEKLYRVFETMERHNVPLLVHGEVTDPDIDIFDREKAFIDRYLRRISVDRFPGLRIVFEHVTTMEAVEFVWNTPNVYATITAHHLLCNCNDLLADGIKPHPYCKPILKSEDHRKALLMAATSGSPKFFLGTDSAPHPREGKESACGCAGIFTAHAAVELYAEAFEQSGALDKLEAFASFHGADFYGLPRNTGTITLVREGRTVPNSYPFGDDELIPLKAGETIPWKAAQAA